jgi:mannosyl-3-phosphoglycerate phosphatase
LKATDRCGIMIRSRCKKMAPAISSPRENKILVFSDLDGTLLDHDTYDWAPAGPSIEALRQRRIPLVLVSSKTLAELEHYQNEFGLEHPVVAENGAAIHIPAGYFSDSTVAASVATSRGDIQSAYRRVKAALGCDCVAFFELGISGIMQATGLSEEQATLAQERLGSEPVLWQGTAEGLGGFEEELRRDGLRCIRGGRFVHIMGDTDKAEAVGKLIDAYQGEWPKATITSISLGDGPNDLGMLARTDVGVIIPGKHDQPMLLESANRIVQAELQGPAGWNEAIQKLLSELNGE